MSHPLDFTLLLIKMEKMPGGVAQLAEQWNHNPRVRGSIPFATINKTEKEPAVWSILIYKKD